MDFNEWRNRYKHRNDISSRLTHLTKGDSSEQAFSTLLKILEEKRLNGSTTESGFIIGNKAAVCLQEAPLNAIAENLLYEKEIREKNNGKVRYSAFGIRFNKKWIYQKGGRPVIYKNIEILVESSEYYRKFIDYCIQNEKVDMLKNINGIVVMDTIFY